MFNEVQDNVAGFFQVVGLCELGTVIIHEVARRVFQEDGGAVRSDEEVLSAEQVHGTLREWLGVFGEGHNVVALFNELPCADAVRVSEQVRSGVVRKPFLEPVKDTVYRKSHNSFEPFGFGEVRRIGDFVGFYGFNFVCVVPIGQQVGSRGQVADDNRSGEIVVFVLFVARNPIRDTQGFE